MRGDFLSVPLAEVTPVVAAFLELKNSPDSLCDTSDYSSSFKSDSNVCMCTYVNLPTGNGSMYGCYVGLYVSVQVNSIP